MSAKTETQFIFTIVPFRLLRDHSLLSSAERDILIQIMAFGKMGCFYSVEHWRKILEKGDEAIYRGLYKLQLLGLISIYKGRRGRSNLYRYNSGPASWNLPRYLQEQLNADFAGMNKPLIQFRDGFKSLRHFINSFNTLHPKYAIKDLDSTQDKESIGLEPLPLGNPNVNENEKWLKKIEKLKEADFFYIASQFHYYESKITEFRSGADSLTPTEKSFLSLVIEKYEAIAESPRTAIELKIMELVHRLEKEGENGGKIDISILNLKNELKKSI